jgi:protein-S-isoprenylcysteine O-methyltransferase Ste14
MRLDIRLPIGLMFGVIGALLVIYGVALSDKAIYERSLGININLWWGTILLAFGVVMFWLGRRGSSSVQSADDTPEGRKMEQREANVESAGRRRGGH